MGRSKLIPIPTIIKCLDDIAWLQTCLKWHFSVVKYGSMGKMKVIESLPVPLGQSSDDHWVRLDSLELLINVRLSVAVTLSSSRLKCRGRGSSVGKAS